MSENFDSAELQLILEYKQINFRTYKYSNAKLRREFKKELKELNQIHFVIVAKKLDGFKPINLLDCLN